MTVMQFPGTYTITVILYGNDACYDGYLHTTLFTMVKNKDRQALRQRNTRRKKKQGFDKYKAFYTYVFIQNPEMVFSFEAIGGQTKDRMKRSIWLSISIFLYLSNNQTLLEYQQQQSRVSYNINAYDLSRCRTKIQL